MAFKYFFVSVFLIICANANAEWFLRGTHNGWATTQMESAGAGSNTMQLNGVVFSAAGGIKFDRYGDWKESYGAGSGNISVAAGTWDIKFFVDTKKWSISAPQALAAYHVRGTHNGWAEGTLMTPSAAPDNYEVCVNFAGGDGNGGPRFKVDPNGGWGDAIPAADFTVAAGWVKITFNSVSKIVSVQQNLSASCGLSSVASSAAASSIITASSLGAQSSLANSSVAAPTSIYHLRGTFNSWKDGTLLNRIGATENYESCINFTSGDGNGGPRFKIDPNGGWGDAIPAADFSVSAGWVKISFNGISKVISVQQNLIENCGLASTSSSISNSVTVKSSVASSSLAPPASIYHLRGTFNSWKEGTLMTRIGVSDIYELCVNFTAGDGNGGPRFKVDPSGGWGSDALPAADFSVSVGWVRVLFNSLTKTISTQQNLPSNCLAGNESPPSSAAAISSRPVSVASSSAAAGSIYHVRGTFNSWQEGALMNRVGATEVYEYCANFPGGDSNGGPRFKIDPNGAWGDALPNADFAVAVGWVKITFNSLTKGISVQQNLSGNCGQTSSSSSSVGWPTTYIVLGTFDGWQRGMLMARVAQTDIYETCIKFEANDNRIRIAPNGIMANAFPASDISLSVGWTKITVNAVTRSVSTQVIPAQDCGISSSSPTTIPVHVRGTFNGWAEGVQMSRMGDSYYACIDFNVAKNGDGRFRVDPNGGWGTDIYPTMADMIFNKEMISSGWTLISYLPETRRFRLEATHQPKLCNIDISNWQFENVSSSSAAASSAPFVEYHVRGTHNAWAENTIMKQVGNSMFYESCLEFPGGDANGGARFKIDPNGGWGDVFPAADFNVPLGPVTISLNSATKQIGIAPCDVESYDLGVKAVDGSVKFFSAFKIDYEEQAWKACYNFSAGANNNLTDEFGVYVNGQLVWPSAFARGSGWTLIKFMREGFGTPVIPYSFVSNLGANCQ